MKKKAILKRCGSLAFALVFAVSTFGSAIVYADEWSAETVIAISSENESGIASSSDSLGTSVNSESVETEDAAAENSNGEAIAESVGDTDSSSATEVSDDDETGTAGATTEETTVDESSGTTADVTADGSSGTTTESTDDGSGEAAADSSGNGSAETATDSSGNGSAETATDSSGDGSVDATVEVTDESITEAADETAAGSTASSVKFTSSGVSLSKTVYTYNGEKKTPAVTVKNTSGRTLTKNTDYTVKFYSNARKNIGQYTVMIYGKGDYAGITVKKTFKIVPEKATLSSASSTEDSRLTVKWSSVSGAERYQIAYKISGGSYKYTTTASLSKTISSLTAGKKYTVKVRAYKVVNGTRYYGSWSSTKTVTVYKNYTETYEGSGIFSNGTYQYYMKKTSSSSSSVTYYLIRKTISSAGTKKVKKFTASSGNEYAVTAVYNGNVYILQRDWYDTNVKTLVFNIKKGKVIKTYNSKWIVFSSGSCAVVQSGWGDEMADRPHSLYKLTSTGMKKIKSLGNCYESAFDMVGTKLYYAVYKGTLMNSIVVYRISPDGTGKKKLCSYSVSGSSWAGLYVTKYTSSYCVVSYEKQVNGSYRSYTKKIYY